MPKKKGNGKSPYFENKDAKTKEKRKIDRKVKQNVAMTQACQDNGESVLSENTKPNRRKRKSTEIVKEPEIKKKNSDVESNKKPKQTKSSDIHEKKQRQPKQTSKEIKISKQKLKRHSVNLENGTTQEREEQNKVKKDIPQSCVRAEASSDGDTDDSDFEEVDNNEEQNVEIRLNMLKKETPPSEQESDDGDFEEVSSQDAAQKPKRKPSLKTTGRKAVNKDTSKDVSSRRKRPSGKKKTENPKKAKIETTGGELSDEEKNNMSEPEESDFEDVPTKKEVRKMQPKKKQTSKVRNKKTIKSEKETKKTVKTQTTTKKDTATKKETKCEDVEDVPSMDGIDADDVTAVLLRMEGLSQAACPEPSTSTSQRSPDTKGSSLSETDEDDDDEEDSEDWEEVEEHKGSPFKSRIPTEPVEITLEAPDFMTKKRKKKKFDWLAYVQRTMRRFQKDVQINMHKVHLLCLLSHGLQQNTVCNDDMLKAQAVSLLPAKWSDRGSNISREGLKQMLKWFREEFPLKTKSQYFSNADERTGLVRQGQCEAVLSDRECPDGRMLALVFLILLRTLGLDVRLVMSLHPLGIRMTENKKYKVKKSRDNKTTDHGHTDTKIDSDKNSKCRKMASSTKRMKKSENRKASIKTEVDSGCDTDSESVRSKKSKDTKSSKSKGGSTKGRQLKKKNRHESDSEEEVKPNRTLRTKDTKKKKMKTKEEDETESEEFVPSDCDHSNFSEEESDGKKRTRRKNSTEQKTNSKRNLVTKKKIKDEDIKKEKNKDIIELSSGSEFTEDEKSFRSPLQEKLKRKNRKVLSSDSEHDTSISVCDVWTEVYLTEEKKWLCIDCVHNIIDKPYEIESAITQPVHYVIAISAEGHVSDVTARYASQWMSQTRKLRVDPEWWTETLEPYKNQQAEHGGGDEQSIKDQLLKRPLPTSIGEFKNHPLYALTRHLLKFEAIYPDTSVPIGYIRREPIYARECVHTLHSRENWLKEGRAVKLGEEAYKMVKSRKRFRQPKPDPNVLDLELFGYWQTEKYIPPPAVDGKITRNEYGNVELFQPWMLPGGTVHLQGFPALNRVAKKLGLDCVPAMVGWDYHGGFSHPLIDGWVVCEEHKDILIAAWDEDQEIQKQREKERREKRVYGNWKLLIKSLLIRERLKHKFDLKDKDEDVEVKGGEKAKDTEQAWPQNRKKTNTNLSKNIETM